MTLKAFAPNPVPGYYIYFGSQENCTLATCNPVNSIYEYRPSLGVNTAFLAIFGACMIVFLIQGFYYRTWSYMIATVAGCISEVIGYAGRIMLSNNPFSFPGFLIQIILLTIAPAFFTAGIYFTLGKIAIYLGPHYGILRPKMYSRIFIPCDLVALVLQAAGGAMSATQVGSTRPGVSVSKAGLIFQVITLVIFILFCADFTLRFWRERRQIPVHDKMVLPLRFKVFVMFLSAAIIFILVRCIFRIDELSDGYSGPLIHNQGLFIALEGVMIIMASICLIIAHPGPVFQGTEGRAMDVQTSKEVESASNSE